MVVTRRTKIVGTTSTADMNRYGIVSYFDIEWSLYSNYHLCLLGSCHLYVH
jgi:hypothetical protein